MVSRPPSGEIKTIEPISPDLDQNEKIKVRCTRCNEIFMREISFINEKHQCPLYIKNGENLDKWCPFCRSYQKDGDHACNRHPIRPDFSTSLLNRVEIKLLVSPVNVEVEDNNGHKIIIQVPAIPVRKRISDAGYDLYSIENITVPSHGTASVETGIAINAPIGVYYTIEGRSSLWMQGIMPFRGIIDATFHGPLKVVLMNMSNYDYDIKKGNRIAQILFHLQTHVDFNVVEDFHTGGRSMDGFGSTGR